MFEFSVQKLRLANFFLRLLGFRSYSLKNFKVGVYCLFIKVLSVVFGDNFYSLAKLFAFVNSFFLFSTGF